MSKINNSRVQSNLLQQNCFVRDVTTKSALSLSSSFDSFVSLDEVITSKGVELKKTENPYPITPQYVQSFVASSDYRNDPLGSSLRPSSSNLGDITDVQKILSMDSSSVSSLYNDLKSKFESKPDSKSDDVSSLGGNNNE